MKLKLWNWIYLVGAFLYPLKFGRFSQLLLIDLSLLGLIIIEIPRLSSTLIFIESYLTLNLNVEWIFQIIDLYFICLLTVGAMFRGGAGILAYSPGVYRRRGGGIRRWCSCQWSRLWFSHWTAAGSITPSLPLRRAATTGPTLCPESLESQQPSRVRQVSDFLFLGFEFKPSLTSFDDDSSSTE